MADAYPDLRANRDYIADTIAREESGLPPHARARARPCSRTSSSALADGATLAGDVAFDLYETYGFPLEVTQEIAAERGIDVDVDGLRSRAAARAGDQRRQDEQGVAVRRPDRLPVGARPVRPHRVRRAGGVRDEGDRARGRPRARRRGRDRPRPHPVLRGVRRPGRRHRHDHHRHGHGRGARHHLRAAGPAPPRRAHRRRRDHRRPGGDCRRSTSRAATRSGATTPARTSSTGRCARCWATT